MQYVLVPQLGGVVDLDEVSKELKRFRAVTRIPFFLGGHRLQKLRLLKAPLAVVFVGLFWFVLRTFDSFEKFNSDWGKDAK
jgi:hypothetical protein